jgi:hypothetical protein
MTKALIIGSGPNAVVCRNWDLTSYDAIVTINNAWQIRSDWTHLIHPSDFPTTRMPPTPASHQDIITADTYVAHQNNFGGFVYAGGTMAFTAAYWTLSALTPTVIAMIGCDMVYPTKGPTHFYGTGTPDPLRNDISLRSLRAKSARLQVLAAQSGCAMINLSSEPSQLTFPRSTPAQSAACLPLQYDAAAVAAALAEEARLGYYVPSGKYWKEERRFDKAAIDHLDQMWLKAGQPL